MTSQPHRRSAVPQAAARLWLPLILLLLLTTWLAARQLDADAIWVDEFFSIYDSGGPPYGPITPAAIWERVSTRNAWHTPGFFIMLSGWGRLVGWEPPALRALAIFPGLLGIAWTYRLGRDLLGHRTGLYAAIILGTSAFLLNYLHELRMYTWFVPLTMFTVWVYLRLIKRPRPHPLEWLGLLVGTLGLLYIHYFAALPLIGLMLYHLIFVPKNRRWWQVVFTLGLAGLLFLPWIGSLLTGLRMASESESLQARALSPLDTLERLVTLFGNGSALLTLVGTVAAAFALRLRSRGVWRVWYFTLMALAAILLTNAILGIMHEGRVRYLIAVWPFMALLMALGLVQMGRLPRPFGALVPAFLLTAWALLGVSASLTPAFGNGIDGGWAVFPQNRVVDILRDIVQPKDVVYTYMPDNSPYWTYARNNEITEFYFNPHDIESITSRTTQNPDFQAAENDRVDALMTGQLRLWMVYRPDRPSANLPTQLEWLRGDYAMCRTVHAEPDLQIDLYTLEPICCDADGNRPALIDYALDGSVLALTGLEVPATVSGDTLPVMTSWRALDVPAETYSVALHVLDGDDNLVAQADAGLEALAFSCQRAEIDVSGLEAGTYRVSVIVYRWQDGVRLLGADAATGESGERLIVDTFEIE
jgi:hypothetical protein